MVKESEEIRVRLQGELRWCLVDACGKGGKKKMSNQGGLRHAATEPSQLGNNKRERRRMGAGRAAALRRAPSDSDCSGETASLSADSAERALPAPTPAARAGKTRSSRSFYSRRRGSEWEVLEGLKDGQRFEKRPEVFNGYLHKKRKWPLKGWHKRFFVIDGGILVYARSPTDVARGRLHGSVDVGLSVISAKQRRRRIDIDADEFIYHLRAKTPDVYRTWLTVLKVHRLYRQHLLTFGARESVPKILHAPLDDLPQTDTSSRPPLFVLSSTSYASSTTEDEVSDSPSDSVIYLTLEGNKEMYSVKPKPSPRKHDFVPQCLSTNAMENRYQSMRRCFTTNMLYQNCYSIFGERKLPVYRQYPVLCSTEFSFASKDSAKPKFSEKRYLCTHHMKMHDHPSKNGSYFAVRKSRKCTNVKRYQIVNMEPKLPAPESQCVILRKYLRKSPADENQDAKHNVDNYRVQIRKRNKNQENESESFSEYENITKKLLKPLLGNCNNKHHADHVKASVNKALKNLYQGPDDNRPVKQLFKNLLEFYLKNTSSSSEAKETSTIEKHSKPTLTQKKATRNVHLSTSYIDTKSRGTQIQELLNQLCEAKTNLLNTLYKSETVQKDVSTHDKNLSGIYPIVAVSKETQINEVVTQNTSSDKKSTSSDTKTSSSNDSSKNASRVTKCHPKHKCKYRNLSSTFSVDSAAEDKHNTKTVNPLAAIVRKSENEKSVQEIEKLVHNTIYTCKTAGQSMNCREYKVVPRTPDISTQNIYRRKQENSTTPKSDTNKDSALENKLKNNTTEKLKGKNQCTQHIKNITKSLDTADLAEISKQTAHENIQCNEDDSVESTTDSSTNASYSVSSTTDKSERDNIPNRILKTFSAVKNSIQAFKEKAQSSAKTEMFSKQTSLDQMLMLVSSAFSEVNKMYSSTQTDSSQNKLPTVINDLQKRQKQVEDTDYLSTKDNTEESNGSMECDIHNVLLELRKVLLEDKKKAKAQKWEPHTFINNHVIPPRYPMHGNLRNTVLSDVNDSKFQQTPYQGHRCVKSDIANRKDYASFLTYYDHPAMRETDNSAHNRMLKTKKSTYKAKIKNVRRCIPKPRLNVESVEKPLPKYMDETFIQLILENMNLILNTLPDCYKELYVKLSERTDYSVEIELLRKLYKKVIASADKEAQFNAQIQLLKNTIDAFTEVSSILLKRQFEDKYVSANASTVDIAEQTSRVPSPTNANLDFKKVFLDQILNKIVSTISGLGQTSEKPPKTNETLNSPKVYSSKTEQTSSSLLYGNLNLINEFSEKKSLIPSSLHQEFLKILSSTKYGKAIDEKIVNVQNVHIKGETSENHETVPSDGDSNISTVTTLHKFSSTLHSPKSTPARYLKPCKTVSAILTDANEDIIRIEEIQKITNYEELPKTYLVVIKKHRRKKLRKLVKQLLSTPPSTPVKASTEIQTSKSLRKRKRLNMKNNWTIFRNATTSDSELPLLGRSSDMNTIYRCTSESSFFSGLISPTSPPIRGPQAGFVSGTPGGRLASWIIESGGPLENASKELGQAQLSVQQLQRLLDALELQQQVHHDTDVSLDGASPNVKKDRRKFGLRKKKSNSKCASIDLAPPPHIDASSSHMALSALTAPPSPGGGASSAPNSAASLPIACAAARPQSLPGAESICGAGGPASLTSLTPDHQLREDFTVLAKDLVASLKSIVGTLVCERGRLRAAMDAADTSSTPGGGGGAVVAALRTNLSSALQQNSELRNRLSRIHDASDLAEISTMGHNADPISRQFQASLSYSSSCVSASEFFDAEGHDHDNEESKREDIIAADETGVIELDGDSSSEVGSLSSEEGSASSDNSDGALLSAEQETLRLNENGIEPATVRSAGWTRRKRLPSPRPTPGGPSLWNLLYKNIGKDLSQISMPVTINEPLNMLQRLCEELEYSELLDAAAECRSPVERMALIAAFAVSAYAAAAHRAASKPFNPLLGETYECIRDDKGFRFIAEQVSHHPPISACHAESPRWCMWQEARIKTKFWGKSMEFQPAGRVHVRLYATGDHYTWNKVTTCVHNLFGGQRWVDQYGDMHITCHQSDISCKLNFIKASSWSTTRHEVRGAVTQPSTGARLRLQGRWSEALHAGEPPAARCLWRPGTMPPEHDLYYGFTRFAMELNELEPGMRELLPHTDTRLRPDQRALEEGDVDSAEQYKHQLEQAQRERRRDTPEHRPRWFRKSMEGNEEMWVFSGEYWKAREAGFTGDSPPAIW